MAWMLLAAGAVAQGLSTYQQGRAQQAQFEVASKANQYNEAVLRQRADTTLAAYGAREEQQRRAARLQEGERMAAIAQSGLGTDGTNAALEAQNETFAELDALNIRYEGELESRGLIAQADTQRYESAVNRMSAGNARRNTGFATAASLFSGASSAYLGYKRG